MAQVDIRGWWVGTALTLLLEFVCKCIGAWLLSKHCWHPCSLNLFVLLLHCMVPGTIHVNYEPAQINVQSLRLCHATHMHAEHWNRQSYARIITAELATLERMKEQTPNMYDIYRTAFE